MAILPIYVLFIVFVSLSLTRACNVFIGMTCTCYESIDIRCTMSKIAPLAFVSPLSSIKKFRSLDLKFDSDEIIDLNSDYFILLNKLLPTTGTDPLSITFRFQNFESFHARTGTFRHLFEETAGKIPGTRTRLIVELHPLKAKSIVFDANTFDGLHLDELSIYADSLTSSFEAIFNNTNITHVNIEGAIVAHDPLLLSKFTGQITSLKVTRMIDTVNSEEFPPFPVRSYTIEAHKMRILDALSFINYTQLTGLNIIQPDVSITPKLLDGLDRLSTLTSLSIDAERIADGALKHVQHVRTLILGSYLKMLDSESLNSLKSLQQLDVRYVHFSTLQGNTSCSLADYINRRRMLGLSVYLPQENYECDCILIFLNNMIDDGEQMARCQATDNDRCLFSPCSIVSEYFTRKQKEIQFSQQQNTPPLVTLALSPPSTVPFLPPLLELNETDSSFYPDSEIFGIEDERTTSTTTSMNNAIEPNIYDDEELRSNSERDSTTTTTTQTPLLMDPDVFENEFSTPMMRRINPEPKRYASSNLLVVSWIPFAIIASCLFLSLVIAMISYIIYHNRRTASFKLVPQVAPIV